ncbi:MAG: sodium/proline symporter [Phycisphaerales bacterium]|nr:sodium/proline symporter [Phycisphaerales bacterium]
MTLFYIAFISYTVLVIGVGVWSSRKASRSDEEYFLAGRSLGPWVAALSASASSESGWVTLGLVGFAFADGVQAYWILPGGLLGFLFNWFILAGKLRETSGSLGAVTIPDYLALRFRERLPIIRLMSVVVILIAMMLYCAAQFAAAGKAFHASFDGMSYQWGVVLGAAIVLIYVTLGGFRAACWTDLLQGLLMVGVLVIFPLWLLMSGNGIQVIHDGLAKGGDHLLEFWPNLTGPALFGFLIGSGALGVNFGYPGQPHVLVRFMALRDRREAYLGGVIAFVWALLVLTGAVTIGLIARALAEDGAPWAQEMLAGVPVQGSAAGEYALVAAARALVPPMLGGLILAAVLSAICSTADSQLVVASSAAANDVYARLIDRRRRFSHAIVNRVTIFLLGIVAVLLVIDQEVNIYKYVLEYGWAILGASFGPQVILAAFWKRATAAGCIAGMASGFLTVLLWKHFYDGEIPIYNLPLAFVVAIVMNVLVSLMTRVPTGYGKTNSSIQGVS